MNVANVDAVTTQFSQLWINTLMQLNIDLCDFADRKTKRIS